MLHAHHLHENKHVKSDMKADMIDIMLKLARYRHCRCLASLEILLFQA